MKNILKILLVVTQVLLGICESEEIATVEILDAIDPDIAAEVNLTTPELISKYKYGVETHHVTTDDGYILELHRITDSPKALSKSKTPVLLMHGLLDSSSGWVVMRPSHGLAYILADHGFDVWLGNSRGNRYSRKHTHLNPDYPEQRKQFWNFSWHEMGVHDLPAMIDYILKQSGRQKLHYIGHSQGTTAYFVMNSERPEYNDKIILANMLCPSAYYGPMPKPFLHYLNSFRGAFQLMTDYMEVYELLPSREFYGEAMQFIFEKINIAFILDGIGPALTGESPEQANTTMAPVVIGHIPSGCSVRQFYHYGQLVDSKRFQKYDYGRAENYLRYGSFTPPEYNLKNIRAKIAFYYVENDSIILGKNVERLMKKFPNIVGAYKIENEHFLHTDFIWGKDAPALVFSQIIEDMKKSDTEEHKYHFKFRY